MTRDQAIKLLNPATSREAIDELKENGYTPEEIVIEVEMACIIAVKALENYREWVCITDDLPNDNDRVLCFSPSLEQSDIGGVSVQWGWCCSKRNTDITHWMKKPESPKGE